MRVSPKRRTSKARKAEAFMHRNFRAIVILFGALVLAILVILVEVATVLRAPAPALVLPVPTLPTASVSAPVTPHEASFKELAHGFHSDIATRTNYLVTSSAEFSKLWKMVTGLPTPPPVDFTKQSVIAVFAGEEPTSGYDITISHIEDASDRHVTVLLTKPGEGCITAQQVTTPYQIIAVALASLPLTHSDIATTTSCE